MGVCRWVAGPRPAMAVMFALLVCAQASHAQSARGKSAWLEKNGHALNLQAQAEDFSDLEPLGHTLAGVRVIALGESTHGDGSTLAMKTRLIRYLHSRLGFDVIAWESGMADVRVAQAAMRDPQVLPEVAASKGIYPIWTASRQLLPLWQYIRDSQSTARPLTLEGFDCKFTGGGRGGMAEQAFQYLQSFFEQARQTRDEDVKWGQLRLALRKLQLPMHSPGRAHDPTLYDAQFVAQLIERIDTKAADFRRYHDEREIQFARQLLVSTGYIQRYVREGFDAQGTFTAKPDLFTRDMGMALNLLWLVEKLHPDRKIIVWAHNGHLTRSFQPTAGDMRVEGVRGSSFALVRHLLGSQAYTLGFLSSEGAYNYPNVPAQQSLEKILPPPAGSLQALCAGTPHACFFLDFTALPSRHWLRAPMSAGFMFHGTGYENPSQMVKDWTAEFDGMIYLRTMEPSQPFHRLDATRVLP